MDNLEYTRKTFLWVLPFLTIGTLFGLSLAMSIAESTETSYITLILVIAGVSAVEFIFLLIRKWIIPVTVISVILILLALGQYVI
ncbi:hypothetical protein [Halobacillus amylolyticus]|uniref:Uncharacterized protein n=1 Tax=Halobacillus amylolyticus TaxID=2932259 RepID=A0ABY4HE52_9BACI|nr:hypothetical protein [Halobacillus amylolyticus]UOR12841.1 hypothetical protein MUO15_04840 [Halobacillus amylolyticus]